MTGATVSEALRKRRELDLPCKHGLIVANAGEGGSFVIQADIEDVLATTDDDVIVIDMFGDFEFSTSQYPSMVYSLSPNGEHHLNPFSLYPDESLFPEDYLSDKANMLVAMMKISGFLVSPIIMSVISQIIERCYQNAENVTTDLLLDEVSKSDYCLYLNEIREILRAECFHGETDISCDKRVTVFRTSSLGRFNLSAAVPILEYLLHVCREKNAREKKTTWLYIPHMDVLVKEDSSSFVDMLLRRARKRGIVYTGSSHKNAILNRNFADLLCHVPCLYLLNPSREDEEWVNVMGVEPEGLVQMMYSFGDEKGSISVRERDNRKDENNDTDI